MKREFLQSLQVEGQPLPKDIIDAIMEKNGQDIQQAKAASQAWEEKYNRAVETHSRQIRELTMEQSVRSAVEKAGGRNVKAISALLDMDAISQAEDADRALKDALDHIKAENDYLFEAPAAPPYARFTGTGSREFPQPATLAGALKARMKLGG